MGIHGLREFPVRGLLPKEETQAAQFIRNNPEYDGRGTVIAILDDGLDPGAPGMQQITSDGRPKIINIVDCTGAGDVSCSKIIEATVSTVDGKTVRTLTGLSGRTLTVGEWENPTGKFRMGLKRTRDLFNQGLHSRLQKEKKKKFEVEHHLIITEVQRELEAVESSTLSKDKKELTKADLKTRLEVLRDMYKAYDDPGFTVDCVVFHDGKKWRAVIDTTGSGDLSEAPLLANYHDELQYHRWSDESMLNYSVNIYDEGETLSIVTPAGSHGTHVSGITAANYPDNPELNGVAPGAQIISLRIGNGRLGSMETAQGIVRAAVELCRLKVDLANISYGEASSIPNTGRFIELMNEEVINKTGTIVVSAAGNAGPALSTAGTPGGTCNSIIGVGAYVTRDMMKAEYAMLDTVDEGSFTWTSRGPTSDGAVGWDIYAPGAAVTCVPQFTMQRSQQMNGTSMASPNCCGCLALLLSGLKAQNISYTPYRIKSAIRNTGSNVSDPSDVKFIQVQNAWTHLTQTASQALPFDVQYEIKVSGTEGRGVYLRELDDTSQPQSIQIEVKPRFFNEYADHVNEQRVKLELRIALVATTNWITAPEHVLMSSTGRTFGVKVDPTRLQSGYHFGQVLGYDTSNLAAGPLFAVPVAVCKPETGARDTSPENAQHFSWRKLKFSPGEIQRRFVAVPSGANFAELTVRSTNRDTPARFIVHMLQLHQQTRRERFEHSYGFSLARNGSIAVDDPSVYKKVFAVLPSVTLEICLAQFWSSLEPSEVDVEITFHGIFCAVSGGHQAGLSVTSGSGGDLACVSAAGGFARLDFFAGVRREEVKAGLSLGSLRRYIRPTNYVISALKSRDILPNTKQLHQLVLTYTITVSEAGSGVNIIPRFPKMNAILYDAWFEGFAVIVYDSDKKELSYQDIYPKAVKVTDGTYTVRTQVVSSSVDQLDKLVATALVLDQDLPKPIATTAYKTLTAATTEDKSETFTKKILQRGSRATAWIPLDNVTTPKDAKQGDLLMGQLQIIGGGLKLDGSDGLYAFAMIVAPEKPKGSAADGGKKDDAAETPEAQLIKEALRDVEISWIRKSKDEKARTALVQRLETEWPEWLPFWIARLEQLGEKAESLELPFLTEMLQRHEEMGRPQMDRSILAEIDVVAKKILSLVDEDKLRKYLGGEQQSSKSLPTFEEADKTARSKLSQEMDTQKQATILAYSWLLFAAGRSDEPPEKLLPTLKALATYLPDPATNNPSYLVPWSRYMRSLGLQGEVVKVTHKWLAEQQQKLTEQQRRYHVPAVERERRAAMNEMKWDLWIDVEREWRLARRPESYSLF
ncbi:subtilase family-domain-containing protein [Powellomyces hirtus]|nr:subtilase family-domain-containing protein [Powellomyces hirtus]